MVYNNMLKYTITKIVARVFASLLGLLILSSIAQAEDGYDLWMRYHPVADSARLSQCQKTFTGLLVSSGSLTDDAIKSELQKGLRGLTGETVPSVNEIDRDGVILAGTLKNSPLVAALRWAKELNALGPEGYRIQSTTLNGHAVTIVASTGEIGTLYGIFDLLRRIQTGNQITSLT
jgi:alpha-glucuronidase